MGTLENNKTDINTYISERLDKQIDWYDNKSIHAQKRYKQFQVIEIILASCIPLLAGYTSHFPYIAFIIGLFGAIIAIIESITKLYKYHENWIQYRSTCELLRFQKSLYQTRSFPYNTEDETIDNIFVRNIENIISSENNQWKIINTMEDSNKNDTTK